MYCVRRGAHPSRERQSRAKDGAPEKAKRGGRSKQRPYERAGKAPAGCRRYECAPLQMGAARQQAAGKSGG
jgi:hypothetical protein